jgi:hypothetical protein
MEKDKLTPEEKLLKIIENPNVEKRPVPLVIRVKGLGLSSLKEWLKNIRIDKDIIKRINLKTINRVIAGICVIITVIWIFGFFKSGLTMGRRFRQVVSGEEKSTPDDMKRPNIEASVDEAVSQAKKRNIFTFLPTKEEIASTINVGPTLSNFKLVGILWSDNPQAMIENTKEQKSYFVSKGDTIGDIEVRKILGDKVIVGKGSEEWELR